MIKYDTEEFTNQLIGFSNFLQKINEEDIEDFFNFAKDEYSMAEMIKIKTQIVVCYTLWKTFHKFELRLAKDPLKDLNKSDFKNFFEEQKRLIAEQAETEEVDALMQGCFAYSRRSASDKMKIGLIIEQFIQEELKTVEKDKDYIPMNIISPGLKMKHLMTLLHSENPTEDLRSILLDCDSAGFKTVEDEQKTIKPKWYEREKIRKSICEKMKYLLEHNLVVCKHGEEIINIPRGVFFYDIEKLIDTKEIYKDTKTLPNRKQSFGDQLSGT